jgi:pyruvyl transferase EpsO
MNAGAATAAVRRDSDSDAFDDLIARPLQLLARLLDGIDSVALVDYPEYANVGDSLIWLGQIALFERLQKKVVYVDAAWHSDDTALRAAVAKGAAIVIMGGGNFGTLWPHHQRFREHLLQTFAAATIIQMPQSIYFDNGAALAQTQRVIAACKNFHLLVRDYPSLDFARANFAAAIELCPDSAFFLGALTAAPADLDIIFLRRSDKESLMPVDAELLARSNLDIEVTDWLQQNAGERLLQKISRGLIRFKILNNTSRLTLHLYNLLARIRARRGIKIIARGHCVITDRLHAHILSILLGRENLVLDNSNGKVFAFYEAWTQRWLSAHKAASAEEAFELASAAVRRAAAASA